MKRRTCLKGRKRGKGKRTGPDQAKANEGEEKDLTEKKKKS